jgi:hypothetical protein
MKRTVNKKFQLGMLAALSMIALVLGMTIVGCSEDPPPPDDYTPPGKTLTGTVTVTNEITLSLGKEEMTLTTDESSLNDSYHCQWIRDGVNISGATSHTYKVTEVDYGKTLKVKVTGLNSSGELFGEFAVPSPTKLILTLKWDSAAGKQNTGITIERGNGDYWGADASTSGNLTTAGTTLTLTSWKETKFKMRTTYTLIETKYYFRKDNASGSELFDFVDGTKTYTLMNTDVGGIGMKDLFATEG